MSEPRGEFTAEEARRVGEEIGIDWASAPFDGEEFRMDSVALGWSARRSGAHGDWIDGVLYRLLADGLADEPANR